MSHVTAKIKAFINDQNICLSGDWVDVLGCNCCNRNVRDDIKGVVEPFYFTLLASKLYQSEILTCTTCVSIGIKFTICNREWEHYPSSILARFIDCWPTFCLPDWTAPILLGSLHSVDLSLEDSSLLKKESSSLSSMDFPSVTLCCSGCCTGLILDTLSLLYPSHLWP